MVLQILFTEKSEFQKEDINTCLSQISFPILTEEQPQTFEAPESELNLNFQML